MRLTGMDTMRAYGMAAVSTVATGYIRLVANTSSLQLEPDDLVARLEHLGPAIFVSWHGQVALMPLLLTGQHRYTVVAANHRDADLVAAICARYGVAVERGSHTKQGRGQGLSQASLVRRLLGRLADGSSVFLTADVPKVPRVAYGGSLVLAARSGRPIVPIAAVSNRRFDLDTWDRASIPKPFGQCCIAIGAPILVTREHDDRLLQAKALAEALDRVHDQAFRAVGSFDPGRTIEGLAI